MMFLKKYYYSLQDCKLGIVILGCRKFSELALCLHPTNYGITKAYTFFKDLGYL
jgi:hypothetical protein